MRLAGPLAAMSLACAGSGVATSEPVTSPDTPRPPLALAGWRFADSSVYTSNGGVSFRYSRPGGFRIDVFEYPILPQGYPCLRDCSRSAVEAEMEAYKASILDIVDQIGLDSIVVAAETQVNTRKSSWLQGGAGLEMEFFDGAKRSSSFVYVFSGRDMFLKVRATYEHGTAQSGAVDSLVERVVATWPDPFRCSHGQAESEGVVMGSTLARSPEALAEQIATAADSLGYVLAFADGSIGRWRTAPRRSWPVGSENESWHGRENPGAILYVSTEPAGDSTGIEVGAYLACEPADGRHRDLEATLPLMSALELVNAIREK